MEQVNQIIRYPNGAGIYLTGIEGVSRLPQEAVDNAIIVSLMDEEPALDYGKRYFFPIVDYPNADISQYFKRTFSIMLHALLQGQHVIVHCRAGISRSVTIVVAFFLQCFCNQTENIFVLPYIQKKKMNWTLSILDFVRQSRPIAEPNSGFMHQLYRLERECIP